MLTCAEYLAGLLRMQGAWSKKTTRKNLEDGRNADPSKSAFCYYLLRLSRYKKTEGDRLIDFGASTRPTRHRLLTAMGISACSVVALLALLGSLVDFAVSISKPEIEHGERLTVHIRKDESEPKSNFIAGNQAVRSLSQEESRASMWRRSHSIMFQPASGRAVKQEEPIISDFRFKPRVHVVGLGVTIGSCFVGIPIAGVPVEHRTVAIRLFVCAKDSG